MDMFMDKLAQKLTAQEIIRANTAAETEELNRLRNQIAEYNDCLAKLQKLIDDGTEKLQAIQAGNAELGNLMEKKLSASNAAVLDTLTGVEKSLQGRLEQINGKLTESADEQLAEKLSAVDENVHKECVKVYRNVQAVILEESEKQKDALSGAVTGMTSAGRKVGTVLKVSVAALVMSLLGLTLQVLNMLNILPF